MASCGDSADSGDDTSTTPIAGSTGLVDCDVDDNAEPLPTTATVGFADTCEISFAGASALGSAVGSSESHESGSALGPEITATPTSLVERLDLSFGPLSQISELSPANLPVFISWNGRIAARNVSRRIELQPAMQITIIVRSLTNRRNEFVVLDTMRVNDFLQLVAERFELFVSAFELRAVVTHVRLRPGGQSLRTIGLRDRSALYIVLRIRGGPAYPAIRAWDMVIFTDWHKIFKDLCAQDDPSTFMEISYYDNATNISYYVNAYTTKINPTMDDVLNKLLDGVRRLRDEWQDREAQAQGDSHDGETLVPVQGLGLY